MLHSRVTRVTPFDMAGYSHISHNTRIEEWLSNVNKP